MATIKISNLHPAGSEFFLDSESYMNEISEGELNSINGGTGVWCAISIGLSIDAFTNLPDIKRGFSDGYNKRRR